MNTFRTDVRSRLNRTAPPEEHDMALTDDDIKKIWGYKNPALEPERDAYAILRETSREVDATLELVKELDLTGMTDEQVKNLSKVVADELARRLAG
jgi:hypothetical protein